MINNLVISLRVRNCKEREMDPNIKELKSAVNEKERTKESEKHAIFSMCSLQVLSAEN